MSMNKAVIMAGGFGTRLRPLTMKIPKPMVPILNYPMMGHIVNLLKEYNLKDIVSVLYFQPEIITDYFKNGDDFGIKMNYVHAVADYGTAGSIRNAHEQINLNERFIIISGDVLTDFNLKEAIDYHIEKGADATILLTRHETPLQYGIVMTDDDGKINKFLEKPSWGQVFSDTINTGIYILEPHVVQMIPFREEFDFSKDLFPLMLKNKMKLYGYIAEGYWRDVGNLDEYQIGQQDAIMSKVKLSNSLINIHQSSNIDPSVILQGNNVIGEDVIIDKGAKLRNCVIGENVKIGENSNLNGVTIWKDCIIGKYTELTDDVLCSNIIVGDNTTIQENTFIADNCIIGENVTIIPNLKLWPDKNVHDGSTLTRSLVQEEKWQRELFTDARITATSNIEINPEFGAKLGACLGMVYGKKSKLIASRDPNVVSRIMKRSITAGLMSTGVSTKDLQVLSIPQTRQELRTGKYDGGFHVRRSTRNPELTDIIFFNEEGRDISISQAKKIERYFYGEEIKRVQANEVGSLSFPERTNEIYIERYISSLDIEKIQSSNLKLLIDYSYGYASTILPSILGKIGISALSLHDYVDATKFHPDPTLNGEAKNETGEIMKNLNYNLGFALESGSEKIAMIDQRGKWYSSQRLLSIVTKLFLETNKAISPYKVAVSITASSEIDLMAREYGVEVIRIKNNHSDMMDATIDSEIKFVGGIYGGFIFPEFLFAADGMYSVGKIVEMLATTGLKPSIIDEQIPRRFIELGEVECNWNKRGQLMRNLMDYSENMKRELVEGVKIFENSNSILFMPSKETASFIIYAESNSQCESKEILDKYKLILKNWLEND